ncbi:MAG: diphosphate--fructose-6-phosphate 1-phosphotransferase [Terriglobia bacterium]
MQANALVAHGGGPTSVLNATLLGVVQEARAVNIHHLWAPRGGLGGLLRGDLLDLLAVPQSKIAKLYQQCSSAIGSFRGKISVADLGKIVRLFRTSEIRYFFYTGGNGSMGTTLRIAAAAHEAGYELISLGIPKTIDNDICLTDHCPGFGSAARFAITALREMGLDQRALPTPVSIVEVMGRNTGWLAASTLLARGRDDDPPHFIYVPEVPFDLAEFLDRVEGLLRAQKWVMGVVAEGLRDCSGRMIASSRGSSRDARGRPLAGDVASFLARLISQKLGARARSEKPGLLYRAFAPCQSPVDAAEAFAAGRFAVRSALKGNSEAMVSLQRARSKHYSCTFKLVPLRQVADKERRLPEKHMLKPANIRDSYRAYAAPLIGPPLIPPVHFLM